MAKKKLLIVCGSGGHAAQALKLYKDLKSSFDCSFLLESSDPLTLAKIKNARVYTATAIRGKKEPKLYMIFRILACSVQSLDIFLRARPDVVLSTGPGIAGPMVLLAKIFGKKAIFIESWSRVTTKSWPGKLLYPFVDQFFVQWPEQKKNYPKATYVGRLG